jgi:hypothetical protein
VSPRGCFEWVPRHQGDPLWKGFSAHAGGGEHPFTGGLDMVVRRSLVTAYGDTHLSFQHVGDGGRGIT